VVVAHAPPEVSQPGVKDAFELQLTSIISALQQRRHFVVVLGDLNAHVGGADPSGAVGRWLPRAQHQSAQPNDNGQRYVSMAAGLELRFAASSFRHKPQHHYTHRAPRRPPRLDGTRVQRLTVKDHVLVSKQLMAAVTDCRAYRCFSWDPEFETDPNNPQPPRRRPPGFRSISDHWPVVATLRVSLRAKPKPVRRLPQPDLALLSSDQQVRQALALQLRNSFAALEELPAEGPLAASAADAAATAEREAALFQQAVAAAVAQHVPVRARAGKPDQPGLSAATKQLIAEKHAARDRSACAPGDAAALAAYRRAKNEARKAVVGDVRAWHQRQAKAAMQLLDAGRTSEWARQAKHMAAHGSRARSSAPMQAVDAAGRTHTSREGVLQAFSDHFAAVLSGQRSLDQAAEQQLEADAVLAEALEEPPPAAAVAVPTTAEVHACIQHLRTQAAAGEDGIPAAVLKADPVLAVWLQRVIAVVWRTGRAPVAWKRALVVALHKKGDRSLPGNYRPISLLSIPGKVYAMLIMQRVREGLDAQLLEAQCGFRAKRGTVDAIFTLRQLVGGCHAKQQPLCAAFVDLAKAFDSVNRPALWQVLRLYRVPGVLVNLLEDLHTGTQAAVRMDGALGSWFATQSGVRQGCVIAPLLFNTFMDFVVRRALARVQEELGHECGIRIFVDGQPRTFFGMLYADDLALLSHPLCELRAMLAAMDQVCVELGLAINAGKTEVMCVDASGAMQAELAAHPIVLSGGPVTVCSAFKYLGSWLTESPTMDKEVAVRKGKAYAAFNSFAGLWSNPHLRLPDKVACYRVFVLPHMLYAAEGWNVTAAQLKTLEVVHNNCMRRMMGVRLRDRHSAKHLLATCKLEPVQVLVARAQLRWAGHVARMGPERAPFVALVGDLPGSRRRGGQRMTFLRSLRSGLATCGLPCGSSDEECRQWVRECASDRVAFNRMVRGLKMAARQPSVPTRVQPPRRCKRVHAAI
jgi:hypothetical protein